MIDPKVAPATGAEGVAPIDKRLNWDQVADDFSRQSYAVLEHYLPPAQIEAARLELKKFEREGRLREAAIGNHALRASVRDVRSDLICWFDPQDLSPVQKELWRAADTARRALNERLFLGALDFEAHYTLYKSGAFYKAHRDSFRDDSRRVLSFIIYLNPEWGAESGGDLVLHTDPPVNVRPLGGTLVLFLSHEIVHEVKISHADRLSFTGWFRRAEI